MKKSFLKEPEGKLVLTVALVILALRILVAALLPLSADEAYYYLYTVNPSLSYFDHPPLVALAGGLFTVPFGINSPFFLRLGPVLFFTAALFPFVLLSKCFFENKKAVSSAVVFLLVPMFFISGALIMPDAVLIFFFTWGLYRFKRAIEVPSLGNWLFFGAAGGCALLSKYSAVFLFAGAALYLLLDKEKRYLLLTGKPYASLAVAAVFFLPVIIWNIKHDFASFSFYFQRSSTSGIRPEYFGQFAAGQIAYLLPFVFFPALYYGIKSAFKLKSGSYQKFVFCFGFVPVAFFFIYSFFSRALYHWAIIGYITLMLPLGKFYLELYRKKRRKFKFCLIAHSTLTAVLIAAVLVQVHWGIFYNREITDEEIQQRKRIRHGDISVSSLGWEKAMREVEKIAAGEDIFLFSDRWFTAGYIAHSSAGKYPVMVLADLKNARGFKFFQDQQKHLGKDGLFITTSRFYSDRRKRYKKYFEDVRFQKALEIRRAGKRVSCIYIYRYKNFLRPYPVNSG